MQFYGISIILSKFQKNMSKRNFCMEMQASKRFLIFIKKENFDGKISVMELILNEF